MSAIEQQIFNLIRTVSQQFPNPPTPRVAGGFVRDKLLGLSSDDIDVALDNMTGSQFVTAIKQFGINNKIAEIGKTYIVDQNLEKSKHLETAGIDIFGQKVEFVNLRSESYGNSRIPTIEMGSPQTDAERRDLTINALFYNIITGQVEDYVGGLEDLKNMHLRTPLDPVKTFMDDPLRALRVVRFHARFTNSTVDPDIVHAMATPAVQEAYRQKVSPERAGPEIMKTMIASNPAVGVRLLFETGLYKSVFSVPEAKVLKDIKMDQQTPHHKFDVMEHTLRVIEAANRRAKALGLSAKDRACINLTAVFHDFGKLHPDIQQPHKTNQGQMSYVGHEDVSAEIADPIMKSIGIGEDDRKVVTQMIKLHMIPHTEGILSNKAMGKFIRNLTIPGQETKTPDLLKYLWQIIGEADSEATGRDDWTDDVQQKQKQYSAFQEFMNRKQEVIAKPLIDGQMIMGIIPELPPKTGFIRDINERLLDAQSGGEISTLEEAKIFVEKIKPEILEKYKSV